MNPESQDIDMARGVARHEFLRCLARFAHDDLKRLWEVAFPLYERFVRTADEPIENWTQLNDTRSEDLKCALTDWARSLRIDEVWVKDAVLHPFDLRVNKSGIAGTLDDLHRAFGLPSPTDEERRAAADPYVLLIGDFGPSMSPFTLAETDFEFKASWELRAPHSLAEAKRLIEADFKTQLEEDYKRIRELCRRHERTARRLNPAHLDWLVHFQVKQWSLDDIVLKRLKVGPHDWRLPNHSRRVRKSITEAADFIRLELRKIPRGRPRKTGPAEK